jgi:hypothetical protein
MVHDYHQQLPGYDERQIWFDGCAECERRANLIRRGDARLAIGYLDQNDIQRAAQRSEDWSVGKDIGPTSSTERPLLELFDVVRYVNRFVS